MKTQLPRFTTAARALLLLAALFLALPGLRAQNARPPERMTYQGFLVDANGVALGNTAPVNHTVEFRIYDASTGGTVKWGESQTVTVDKGYFSVMLGDGSPIGAPVTLSSVFQGTDASDRFISVKVTSLAGSSEILPRLRLVTSPYAYMATTLPAGAITNGLFAAASITGDKLATNTLTAANFSTNVGLWTANGTNIYRPNGFVGIGTTNTLFPLQVRAGLNQNLVVEPGSSVSFSGAVAIRGVNDANLNNIPVAIFGTPISLLGTTVGIGTTNPVAWLDVRGAGVGGIALGDYNNTNSRYIGIIHPTQPANIAAGSGFSGVEFGGPANGTNGGSSGMIAFHTHNFGGGSAERMRIEKLGNVGIGTSTPAYPLDVNGQIRGSGYIARNGALGAYSASVFNVGWPGGGPHIWIDTVDFGQVAYTSDRRLKENVEPMQQSALKRILELKPVSFKYKNIPDSIFSGSADTNEGFIADELQAVIPSAVNGDKAALTKDGKIHPQTLNPIPVISVLTKATQELARQVKAQEAELTELRAELAKLRTEKKTLAATVTELKAQDEARESRLARLEKALDSRTAVIEAKATTRNLNRP